MARADGTNVPPMDMKLEVVGIGVPCVDWLDADFAGGEFRAVEREWEQ